MPNRFTPINTSSPTDKALNQINQNFARLDNESVTKVFSGQGGMKAVIQGRLPNDTGYGQTLYDNTGNAVIYMAVKNGQPILKVAKAGKDAITGDDSDMIFNSSQNTFKIIQALTFPLNRAAGNLSISTTIPAPVNGAAFQAWATVTNASPYLTYPVPHYSPNGTGGMLWGIRAYYDPSVGSIRFFHESYDASVTSQTYTVNIKYYILQETVV